MSGRGSQKDEVSFRDLGELSDIYKQQRGGRRPAPSRHALERQQRGGCGCTVGQKGRVYGQRGGGFESGFDEALREEWSESSAYSPPGERIETTWDSWADRQAGGSAVGFPRQYFMQGGGADVAFPRQYFSQGGGADVAFPRQYFSGGARTTRSRAKPVRANQKGGAARGAPFSVMLGGGAKGAPFSVMLGGGAKGAPRSAKRGPAAQEAFISLYGGSRRR